MTEMTGCALNYVNEGAVNFCMETDPYVGLTGRGFRQNGPQPEAGTSTWLGKSVLQVLSRIEGSAISLLASTAHNILWLPK